MPEESVFAQFINQVKTVEGVPIVNAANPVQWGNLGKSIVAGVVAAFTLGVTNIFGSIADVADNWFTGLTEFVAGVTVSGVPTGLLPGFISGGETTVSSPGVIDLTIGRFAEAVAAMYAFNVAQFGILAAPATLAITLASLFIVQWGATNAWDQFTGDS